MLVIHNWKKHREYMPKAGELYRIGYSVQTAIFRTGTIVIARVDKDAIPDYKRMFARSFYVVI